MRYNAFFISPKGKMVPVPDRHVVAIANDPKLFGLTVNHIKTVYKKHKEDVGWEGDARNEIILELLKKDWVRLRFSTRGGTWRLQIHEELNNRLKKNILSFCQEIKKGNITNAIDRTADPQIEIHDTNEERIFIDSLDETIQFLNHFKQKLTKKKIP